MGKEYLYLERPDGTTTILQLFEGGYVECFGIDRVCVHVPGEAFDAIAALLEQEKSN